MDVALPAIFGVVGVVLGALLASAFELWKRALDGQAAARIIRLEIMDNKVKARDVVDVGFYGGPFEMSGWREHRLVVALFLDESDLVRLARSYTWLPGASRVIRVLDEASSQSSSLHEPTLLKDDLMKKAIDKWVAQTGNIEQVLRKIESANPFLLASRLLCRRPVATENDTEKTPDESETS